MNLEELAAMGDTSLENLFLTNELTENCATEG